MSTANFESSMHTMLQSSSVPPPRTSSFSSTLHRPLHSRACSLSRLAAARWFCSEETASNSTMISCSDGSGGGIEVVSRQLDVPHVVGSRRAAAAAASFVSVRESAPTGARPLSDLQPPRHNITRTCSMHVSGLLCVAMMLY